MDMSVNLCNHQESSSRKLQRECWVRKNDLVLISYAETNFGGDMDNLRSTSGYIFLCGGTGIS